MPSFPDPFLAPLVTVHPWSMESIGAGLQTIGNTIGNSMGSTVWKSKNRAIFIPFWVYTPTTFVMAFLYNGSVVAGNVDVGIYASDGTRIASLGATAQSGTSVIQLFTAFPNTRIGPGLFFMALVSDNATATTAATSLITTPQQKLLGTYEMASASPLPATATFATNATMTVIPLFGLSTKTVL